MIKLSFKPKQISKKLLSVLNDRSRDILIKRYGLGTKDANKMTLEAIGSEYSITRERVRQIEEHSLSTIRKSKIYEEIEPNLTELAGVVDQMGAVISEQELLEEISNNESERNHIHFMLVVGNPFFRKKEDDNFHHRWFLDQNLVDEIEESIKKLYESLNDETIISESEIIQNFLNHVKNISDKYRDEEIIKRWLRLSKKISSNPLGEWGKVESPNISVKGIRDYAFLVIRKHGSPVHFKEVAELITQLFGKKAHVATCHNELIKDDRFVLVGRGLYALKEWGYSTGVVRDVIEELLKKHGPLTKDEIIDQVLKERYVKENTILVNLQNSKNFKKDREGKYHLV